MLKSEFIKLSTEENISLQELKTHRLYNKRVIYIDNSLLEYLGLSCVIIASCPVLS